MIVVDGDSVALGEHEGKPLECSWPQLLATGMGERVRCLAKHQSTSRDCLLRVGKAEIERPQWYILQLGQWSQNHELEREFEANVREIIERMLTCHSRVCLVTPPVEVYDGGFNAADVLRRLDDIYRTSLADVRQAINRDSGFQWFDGQGAVKCHFSFEGAVRVAGLVKEAMK